MSLTIAMVRPFKGGLIIKFEDIEDRSTAEIFRGRTLLISASEAQPLDAGEYFIHDLIDLEVRDEAGTVLGRVRDVYPMGWTHMLGITVGAKELMIPFNRETVSQVDLESGFIVITPTPGLLDL